MLASVAEGYRIGCSMSYNVLNYRLVCDAFFNPEGDLRTSAGRESTVCIHGLAGDEQLSLSVRDGVPSVLPSEPGRSRNWSSRTLKRWNCFLHRFHPVGASFPPAVQAWLPLPIRMYKADEVRRRCAVIEYAKDNIEKLTA